jgi:hypothetical protein
MARKRKKLTREFWQRDAEQKRQLQNLIDRYRRRLETERATRGNSAGE